MCSFGAHVFNDESEFVVDMCSEESEEHLCRLALLVEEGEPERSEKAVVITSAVLRAETGSIALVLEAHQRFEACAVSISEWHNGRGRVRRNLKLVSVLLSWSTHHQRVPTR